LAGFKRTNRHSRVKENNKREDLGTEDVKLTWLGKERNVFKRQLNAVLKMKAGIGLGGSLA